VIISSNLTLDEDKKGTLTASLTVYGFDLTNGSCQSTFIHFVLFLAKTALNGKASLLFGLFAKFSLES